MTLFHVCVCRKHFLSTKTNKNIKEKISRFKYMSKNSINITKRQITSLKKVATRIMNRYDVSIKALQIENMTDYHPNRKMQLCEHLKKKTTHSQ